MSIATDMVAQLANVVASQGIDGTFGRAKDPAASIPVRFLMKHPGVRDEAIVNAYGVNAQVITLPHTAEFAATPPEKFDFVVQTSRKRQPAAVRFRCRAPTQSRGCHRRLVCLRQGQGGVTCPASTCVT